ncbi:hypothetical protein [Streptomyces sp. NPDC059003]|uniref:hypothetical protein n=1 Tax=Streptomyces sp. NPDC059003 TaxID=3346691 RepID=UPI0036806E99
MADLKEIMAWQPPVGWDQLSGERRRRYLERQGIPVPFRPDDWLDLTHSELAAYREWRERLLNTPEEIGVNTLDRHQRELGAYRKDLAVWAAWMCWWALCFLAALLWIWWDFDPQRGNLLMRVLGTAWVVAMYAYANFTPLLLTKPHRPTEPGPL